MDYEMVKNCMLKQIQNQMDYSKETTDQEIQELIDNVIEGDEKIKLWKVSERRRLSRDLYSCFRGWDVLQELLDREDVTEIMVNGFDRIFIERNGQLETCEKRFESEEKLRDVIGRMVAKCNRRVNDSSPIVDARLPSGERINVVLPPVAIGGAILTIRKFSREAMDVEGLVKLGALTEEMGSFLGNLVKAGYNILISGGTGSGKTTLLGALSSFIPRIERVITIEDSAELQMKHLPNLVRMEVRNANQDGSKEVTLRDLIKTALRMRPTRIVVGEVRGKEAVDLLQCLNTGHAGSMSTGHANSAQDMLSRLEMMVLMGMDIPLQAVKAQIASGIDILVHLGRLRDGSRKILEISEVLGMEEGEIKLHRLYAFRQKGIKDGKVVGNFERMESLQRCEKLKEAGLSLPFGDVV